MYGKLSNRVFSVYQTAILAQFVLDFAFALRTGMSIYGLWHGVCTIGHLFTYYMHKVRSDLFCILHGGLRTCISDAVLSKLAG